MAIALCLSFFTIGLLIYANNRLRGVVSAVRLERSKRNRKVILEKDDLKRLNKEYLSIIKEIK